MSSIRDLYEAVLALPPAERESWLLRHCADEGLRRRVLAMVEAPAASAPLARPLDELADALGDNGEAAATLPSGGRIGPFELVGVLGQGGFSTVYRGVRDVEGVAHEVAIKLLHRGLHTAAAQRQFRREQRALAQLRHPNIASLIEGGVTDAGLPYIALELVEGERITEHACRLRLGLRARLDLLLVVCAAVEAAHRALIVHRDLKPANVLVTGEGHVKLLDFGIAKLLDEVDADDATRTGHQPFTPAYAAPEQRAGTQVTTATDVYALGVLLGELVSGQRLNDGKGTTPASYISGDEPAGVLPEPAAMMRRRLRGDLGAIVQKALADEPERRYVSAAGLADDVRRLLEERPVSARKPTRWYRTRRFVQRHRGGVAMTVAVMLTVLAALGVALWQGRIAYFEAQRANTMRDFLLHVFAAAKPAGPRLAPPSVADVVVAGIAEAQKSRELQPRVRIGLVSALGDVLRGQGEYSRSVELLRGNHDDAVVRLDAADPVRVEAGLVLAKAEELAGDRAQARARLDDLLVVERLDESMRAQLLATSAQLSAALFQKERALEESVAAVGLCARACNAAIQIEVLLARGDVLAAFYADLSARAPLQKALALQREMYQGPHVAVAETLQRLSRVERRLDRLEVAEALARESLAIVEASVSDPHRARAEALDTLWQILIDSNRGDEAVAVGERVVAMDEATLGSTHPAVATSKNTLGFVYNRVGDSARAIAAYREALAISARYPVNARRTATYKSNLGDGLGMVGSPAEGIRLVREALADLRALPEPDFGEICSALEKLGKLQLISGDAASARDSYAESDAIYRTHLRTAPPAWHIYTLVGLGHATGLSGDSAGAIVHLRDALERIEMLAGLPHHIRVQARAALAEQLAVTGEMREARRLATQAAEEARHAPSLGKVTLMLLDRIRPLLVEEDDGRTPVGRMN